MVSPEGHPCPTDVRGQRSNVAPGSGPAPGVGQPRLAPALPRQQQCWRCQNPAVTSPSEQSPTPGPGWFPDGTDGILRAWDGHAWEDRVAQRPQIPAPAWRRTPFAFLGQKWFGIAAAGYLIGLALAITGAAKHISALAIQAAIGTITVMFGFLMVTWRRLRLADAIRARSMLAWGVVGGVVAYVGSVLVEVGWGRVTGAPMDSVTFMLSSGTAEEAMKLLVPVVLYLCGRHRDPRAGLAVALGSAAMFGIIEGVGFTIDAANVVSKLAHPGATTMSPEIATVVMAVERPFAELMHPIFTGFVAAIAWRAAWKRGKIATGAGVGALIIAIVAHTANDMAVVGIREASLLSSLVIILGMYFLGYKRACRNLVPPEAVAVDPPGWRPHLRHSVVEA